MYDKSKLITPRVKTFIGDKEPFSRKGIHRKRSIKTFSEMQSFPMLRVDSKFIEFLNNEGSLTFNLGRISIKPGEIYLFHTSLEGQRKLLIDKYSQSDDPDWKMYMPLFNEIIEKYPDQFIWVTDNWKGL